MQIILLAGCAYLFGSIPTGKIVGYFKHIDIQKHGSGNIGFANVVRVLGWQLGIIVLIGDVAKGYIPTLIALQYFGLSSAEVLIVGFMPILGHAFPPWLKFRGGKSIATGLGVLLALTPPIAFLTVSIYCLTFVIFKKSAIASLTAVWLLPLAAVFSHSEYSSYFLLFALFATYTHRKNIKNLLNEYAV